MVLTALADPTLAPLRGTLNPAELQALHGEAVRRLTQVVKLALALPRETS